MCLLSQSTIKLYIIIHHNLYINVGSDMLCTSQQCTKQLLLNEPWFSSKKLQLQESMMRLQNFDILDLFLKVYISDVAHGVNLWQSKSTMLLELLVMIYH